MYRIIERQNKYCLYYGEDLIKSFDDYESAALARQQITSVMILGPKKRICSKKKSKVRFS